MDTLERNIKNSLRKAVSGDAPELSERIWSDKVSGWWDGLDKKNKEKVLRDLGMNQKDISHTFSQGEKRSAFEDLSEDWQSELVAYWDKHERPKKYMPSKSESVLGERFGSGQVKAAGKEALISLGKLKSSDENFIRNKVKTASCWKKIPAMIDDIVADAQKQKKEIKGQDVANVLSMMIRQVIEKEANAE